MPSRALMIHCFFSCLLSSKYCTKLLSYFILHAQEPRSLPSLFPPLCTFEFHTDRALTLQFGTARLGQSPSRILQILLLHLHQHSEKVTMTTVAKKAYIIRLETLRRNWSPSELTLYKHIHPTLSSLQGLEVCPTFSEEGHHPRPGFSQLRIVIPCSFSCRASSSTASREPKTRRKSQWWRRSRRTWKSPWSACRWRIPAV